MATSPLDVDGLYRTYAPAVFRMHNSMCEVATHRAWAERTVAQSDVFGAHPETSNLHTEKEIW